MRVRITSSPPLPPLKAWFSLSVLPQDAFVSSLAQNLCSTVQALRACPTQRTRHRALLDDFELLPETLIDVLRDGDLIWYLLFDLLALCTARLNEFAPAAASSPRETVKPTAILAQKRNLSPTSSSSDDDTSDDSSDDSSTSSSSDPDSDSVVSSSETPPTALSTKKPVPKVHPQTPHIPPGYGKPQTHSRNLRRRKKHQYEREAAQPAPASVALTLSTASANALPIGIKTPIFTGASAMDGTPEPVAMMSLSNKNKRRGFKRSMAGSQPQRIVFNTDDGPAAATSAPPSKLPRLIPPSEKQAMGLLPANMFVTSVDVEAGMSPRKGNGAWQLDGEETQPRRKKRRKDAAEEDYEAAEDIELPYDDDQAASAAVVKEGPDWEEIEKRWETLERVQKGTPLRNGGLVGWKVSRVVRVHGLSIYRLTTGTGDTPGDVDAGDDSFTWTCCAVATHILHHTTRAAAAAQNQAGHTLRNVLGLQSSGSQSASTSLGTWNGAGSSSWGSGHAGAGGGAKYHTGSRFYSGYTGPGRAITQANTASTSDAQNQSDDTEDVPVLKPIVIRTSRKPRSRSHSFSVAPRSHAESVQEFGVLKAVQLHVRSRHAFAEPPASQGLSSADSSDVLAASPEPGRVRRNSTSSTASFSGVSVVSDDLSSPPSLPFSSDEPAAPQTVLAPGRDSDPASTAPSHTDFITLFGELNEKTDPIQVRCAIAKLRAPDSSSTIHDWNAAFRALVAIRKPGQPVTEILETYNDMVTRSISPSTFTYGTLIDVLCERDHEVSRVCGILGIRNAKRKAAGLANAPETFVDEQRIAAMRLENNFASAMALFQASISLDKTHLPKGIYTALLRSCANHSAVDAAIRVFGHLEARRDIDPSASVYGHLISVYSQTGDLEGAKVVFEEFKRVCQSKKVFWDITDDAERARYAHVGVWNAMVEAYFHANDPASALGLLEQMLDTPNGVQFGVTDVPTPSLSTFHSIIDGFCRLGDIQTGLAWFERLLQQDLIVEHPFAPTPTPPRPDSRLWNSMILTLVNARMVPDANRLFKIFLTIADKENLYTWWWDRAMIYHANMCYLEENRLDSDKAVEILDFVTESVIGRREYWGSNLRELHGPISLDRLVSLYADYGRQDKAVEVIRELAEYERRAIGHSIDTRPKHETVHTIISVSTSLLQSKGAPRLIELPIVLRLASIWFARGMHLDEMLAAACNRSYAAAKASGQSLALSLEGWETMAYATGAYPSAEEKPVLSNEVLEHTLTLLTDMAREGVDPSQIAPYVMDHLMRIVLTHKSFEETSTFLANLGPTFEALLANAKNVLYPVAEPTQVGPESVPLSPDAPRPVGRIDAYHSRFVDQFTSRHNMVTPVEAYYRFEHGAQLSVYPTPEVLSHLIEALGRIKEMEKVYTLYDAAQTALGVMQDDRAAQASGWAAVENSMIIAQGHAGDGIRADMHRMRMLEHGSTPSADAYGALIHCIKETTDDTARAMAYFEETQERGVVPNIFLFNTIISKLAKARKADFAIELFQKMKSLGIHPSSVSYGAVIAACCRVGDSASAETLFEEMSAQPNFRPRIPPYNTMMQFYVQTKPNRERFLHFYERMQNAGIKPTAHTYKLLIDVHGTIEPFEFTAMEATFSNLLADGTVQVQGSHWAALINAYGCVAKNLEKAISLFDSIATHRSTIRSGLQLPDAVTFEALINVLVTLRRTDLMPQYIERLRTSSVHMTAYIANLFIRGYAAVGDIEKAREIFEGLVDPPVGVAAPNNHTPHDAASSPSSASPNDPVYREPSTWEAMVRAELGNGNRNEAVALLERIQARHYPESIYNRISGIMLDDSVSPWPSDSGSPSGIYSP
ncbi:hypothetical protein EW146_g3796 [Bondarzewia mesenterica]|uniref:PROP1-like PPR domain-containing protein n=1 Tax=Bondarzewia mesenterica TaxID=1095465 RepID=A0A4S4LWH9_9AGAM|nr:hypothetical protein EW146_g3796 [Bondarzewia mesenterica]